MTVDVDIWFAITSQRDSSWN